MVLFKGTMHQFGQFFNVPNMTFSTFNIKFDIEAKIKVNIFQRSRTRLIFRATIGFML